ncbi:uncharacterized protein IL334_003571 [Kwoniella shivajii]|uniref:Mediator of RNA polymerase II transcription subunit 10 n=1 Tax=Kwoniella shivajii TaxID=564305 RepID=A0ABZ1D208_9TREE|nr:hypothetical protein IL334_003571 [Kwoniella shivajii]
MSLGPPHLPSPALTPRSELPQPAANSIPDQAALRAELEITLLRLTQDLYELEICAGDVEKEREDAVPTYLMNVNQGFINLERIASQLGDSVPHQVVDHIDRFKNPHVVTKNTLTRAVGENQYALGRVLGLESFRRQLHDALSSEFPEAALPERRHHPIVPIKVDDEECDGNGKVTRSNGGSDVSNVKVEEGREVVISGNDQA